MVEYVAKNKINHTCKDAYRQPRAHTHTRAHLVKPIQTSVCLFPCPKRNNAITALAHMNSFTPSAQLFLLIKRLASGTEGENSEGFKTEEKERE